MWRSLQSNNFFLSSFADLVLIPLDPDAGSVADPVPFKPWIWHPRSVKKDPEPRSGSGRNKPNHISESLERIFWVENT
jgi:hypothetical protein